MNRTKIDWCDYTWNPAVGCWGPGGTREDPRWCPYCYAKRIAERFKGGSAYPLGFEPTCHLSKRINEPVMLKKPSWIFVGSMTDMLGPWSWRVPWNGAEMPGYRILQAVIDVVKKCPQHTFVFLTKHPERVGLVRWPSNAIVGTTVTSAADAERIRELVKGSHFSTATPKARCMVSFEPLMGDIGGAELSGIDWVIIGAQTGPGAKPPKPEWVQAIIDQAREARIPVFLKDNLHWPDGIRELPEVGR